MVNVEFYDKHNMVAYLKKPFGSEGFQEIVDFLNGSHIRYALTKNPTIYVSFIKKFWQTSTVRTVDNGEQEITTSDPIPNVPDEVVYEEWDDRVVVESRCQKAMCVCVCSIAQYLRLRGDDLVMLWNLVKERFSSTEPTDDKERTLWVELKRGWFIIEFVTHLDGGGSEEMDLETAQLTTTAKLPTLKQSEYEMWRLRIEQYFQVQDYALWDVIENGNSFQPAAKTTTNVEGTSTTLIPGPVTADEKIQKKNDVKARSIGSDALLERLMTFLISTICLRVFVCCFIITEDLVVNEKLTKKT
ncbi:hypothetical protein Tco_0926998 [Tanacetum coccineum]|uniref:Uncharacterized protein n=1 Tax=Tanacetum coccineum TaxID=301880 RepID=A0ABQ5DIC9_9ASTR